MNNPINICLWFNHNAKAAATLYTSIFSNSNITMASPMVVNFTVGGQEFMGLNGGPAYVPNPAISFHVICETPAELENAWVKLQEGGTVLMPLDQYPWSSQYGWVQDQYGVSWQLALGNIAEVGQAVTPTLMFTGPQAGQAEAAIHFYTNIFKNAAVTGILRYQENENEVSGTVKHAQFKLGNQVFMAMDSGRAHQFTFNEGISLVVNCQNQSEIDYYWEKLSAGGREDRCGWLKDQFGVSWQIVPAILNKLMADPEKAPRVMEAFLKMKKFDIQALTDAGEVPI